MRNIYGSEIAYRNLIKNDFLKDNPINKVERKVVNDDAILGGITPNE